MANISFVNFDKDGALLGAKPVLDAGVTDVVLVVHGWHEDQVSAAHHYGQLLTALDGILASEPQRWGQRKVAYVGVIWPSDKYADDLTVIDMRPDVGGPPPVGLPLGGPHAKLSDADLQARARDVAAFLGIDDKDALAAQALVAANDPTKRDAFVAALRAAAEPSLAFADPQTLADHDEAFSLLGGDLFNSIGHELQHLFSNVETMLTDNPLVRWLKHLRGDANAVIAHILNTFAYNELKIRAGVVGQGLARTLVDNFLDQDLRVHLVGHSFGGRVMSSAAAAAKGPIANLTLLEGAFSQNALTADDSNPTAPIPGAFQSVVAKAQVSGRISAVHSQHDTAVWIAYPLASRVFRDSYSLGPAGPLGQIFGGPTDRYGAIGANGPQNLAGVHQWTFSGGSLPGLVPGVHSLECQSFVKAHTDVWNKGCAFVVAAGLLL